MRTLQLGIKRCLDVVCSLVILVGLLPVWLVLACLVGASVSGSVFFRQRRTGWRNQPFRIVKYRTMNECLPMEEAFDIDEDETRSPRFGRFLRRTKLDEMPQLWNVLIGQMSIVGPRPYIERQSAQFSPHRLDMRPGMTGLAQVNGNCSLSWEDREVYDLYYNDHFSLGLDLWILLRTLRVIFCGEKRCLRAPDEAMRQSIRRGSESYEVPVHHTEAV